MRLLFSALALACARPVHEESKGGPRSGPTGNRNGIIAIGTKVVRRDAHIYEVSRARDLLLERLDGLTGQDALRGFYGFWSLLQTTVAGAGDNHTVASALSIVGRELRVQAAAALSAPSPRKAARPDPEPRSAKRQKGAKAQSPKKGDGKKREPNSTGQLCKKFVADGECGYGAKCIHRHPRDRADTSVAGDTRD